MVGTRRVRAARRHRSRTADRRASGNGRRAGARRRSRTVGRRAGGDARRHRRFRGGARTAPVARRTAAGRHGASAAADPVAAPGAPVPGDSRRGA